jgi:hypothetical protein
MHRIVMTPTLLRPSKYADMGLDPGLLFKPPSQKKHYLPPKDKVCTARCIQEKHSLPCSSLPITGKIKLIDAAQI